MDTVSEAALVLKAGRKRRCVNMTAWPFVNKRQENKTRRGSCDARFYSKCHDAACSVQSNLLKSDKLNTTLSSF